MNIAFDIDGVLFPIEDYQLQKGTKYFKSEPVDENGYGIKEVFDVSSEEEAKFWITHTFDYNRNVKVPDGFKELIDNLRKNGNSVYIITSRAMANKKNIAGSIMRKVLMDALERNGIEVDDIVFTDTKEAAADKARVIAENNIHIMVEDRKENIEEIKDITTPILYSTKNNSDYAEEGIKRANNPYELKNIIEEYINEYNKNKIEMKDYKIVNQMSNQDKIEYFKELRNMFQKQIEPLKITKCRKGCLDVLTILRKAFIFLYKPIMINTEKFPTQEGIILAANHLHSFDPLLIMQNHDIPFRLLAKSAIHDDKILSKLFDRIGSIYVDGEDKTSKNQSKIELISTVLAGENVMMFPEGTRNRTDKKLLDFHLGTVSVAQITGKPIYPIAINADYRLFKNNLCAVVGEPMYIKPTDNLVEKNNELANNILLLMKQIEEYEISRDDSLGKHR